MKGIMPDNCKNRKCPFWDDKAEEHCNKIAPQSEEWIKKYCDNQER